MTVAKISTKSAAPKIVNGILKAGSSCRTLVVGNPPRYAAKKRLTKTAPTPSRANKTVVNFLSAKVNFKPS
jgi:hypothetical protein